jgi:hypothetical protein
LSKESVLIVSALTRMWHACPMYGNTYQTCYAPKRNFDFEPSHDFHDSAEVRFLVLFDSAAAATVVRRRSLHAALVAPLPIARHSSSLLAAVAALIAHFVVAALVAMLPSATLRCPTLRSATALHHTAASRSTVALTVLCHSALYHAALRHAALRHATLRFTTLRFTTRRCAPAPPRCTPTILLQIRLIKIL